MARSDWIYRLREGESWVGPSRGCSCEPRWRWTIAGWIRVCNVHGKRQTLRVKYDRKRWSAHLYARLPGTWGDPLRGSKTGFRSVAAAKAWATAEFYRKCRQARKR